MKNSLRVSNAIEQALLKIETASGLIQVRNYNSDRFSDEEKQNALQMLKKSTQKIKEIQKYFETGEILIKAKY